MTGAVSSRSQPWKHPTSTKGSVPVHKDSSREVWVEYASGTGVRTNRSQSATTEESLETSFSRTHLRKVSGR